MNLRQYQQWSKSTAIYPTKYAIEYCSLGLTSEAGEVAGKIKKWIRDGTPLNEVKSEIGDCLWCCARLADECGWDLQEILEENVKKLEDRKSRNRLSGSGDKR